MTRQKYYVNSFKADIGALKSTIEDIMTYFDGEYSEMDEASRLELKVVVNELLINSVKHGVREGDSCLVKVIAGFTADDTALFVVEDDGDGYDTGAIACDGNFRQENGRTDEINETGRGIFIVKRLCEDFMVNEKGNKVVINKKLHKLMAG